jgi:hypothetical protein
MLVEQRDMRIRVFDTTGRAIGSVGRRGQGPGELTSMFAVGLAGDTLWATDDRTHRIHLFTLAGIPIGSRDFAAWPRPQDMDLQAAYAYLNGNAAVLRLSRRDLGANYDPGNGPWMLVRVSAARGAGVDTLLRVDKPSRVWTVGRGGITVLAQPFDDALLWTLSPTGAEIIVVERPMASSVVAQVTVRRISTTSRREQRAAFELRVDPIPPSTVDTVIERRASAMNRAFRGTFPSLDAARAALRPGLFIPSYFPALQRVVAGSDGSVWLQRFARDEWIVLDGNGRIARVVLLPIGSAANLLAATIDRAWVAETSANGAPQVVRYDPVRR